MLRSSTASNLSTIFCPPSWPLAKSMCDNVERIMYFIKYSTITWVVQYKNLYCTRISRCVSSFGSMGCWVVWVLRCDALRCNPGGGAARGGLRSVVCCVGGAATGS
jgi:hypothetical protein